MSFRFRLPVVAAALALLPFSACGKDEPPQTPSAAKPSSGAPAGGYGFSKNLGDDIDKKAGDALKKGKEWLLAKRDTANGAWGATKPVDMTVGYTALGVLATIAATPKEAVASDPTILQGLGYLASKQNEKGAISGNDLYVNYETSAALAALAAARVQKFAAVQTKAKDFLISSQIQKDESSIEYGGFPYVDDEPGNPTDLSNLQFALAALHDAGVPADHPVFVRAQKFLARVQNRSETNTFTIKKKDEKTGEEMEIASGNDGGAFYAPGSGKMPFVKRADGKYEVKSYGSMTYALVKCLMFAGAKADDPRVLAAVGWISRNFALDRNPGFETEPDPSKKGQQGYYYYLRTMTRALAEVERVSGKALPIADANGKAHDWRREVAATLAALQHPDGSWVNDKADRWEEGNPLLATAYAMEALATCQGRIP